mgnify:CR=1 FL=1
MSSSRETRDKSELIEIARTDPGTLYDEEYYKSGCSEEGDGYHAYGRNDHWNSFFSGVAKKIDRLYGPKAVMDAGCAFGLLVEQLCDRGIDARGFDISPYAVEQARADMKERIKVGSILEPIPLQNGKKYDLVISIEVLEHWPPEHAEAAVKTLCDAGDRVIFSSSPDDFDEVTHFNVLPTERWIEMFAAHGFHPSDPPDAPYIAPQARVVENANAPKMPKQTLLRKLTVR